MDYLIFTDFHGTWQRASRDTASRVTSEDLCKIEYRGSDLRIKLWLPAFLIPD